MINIKYCRCGCKEKVNNNRNYIFGHYAKVQKTKGKTYEQVYGIDKARKIINQIKKTQTGRTLDQIHGKSKANFLNQNISKSLNQILQIQTLQYNQILHILRHHQMTFHLPELL
jgi:hypothetical protein